MTKNSEVPKPPYPPSNQKFGFDFLHIELSDNPLVGALIMLTLAVIISLLVGFFVI